MCLGLLEKVVISKCDLIFLSKFPLIIALVAPPIHKAVEAEKLHKEILGSVLHLQSVLHPYHPWLERMHGCEGAEAVML